MSISTVSNWLMHFVMDLQIIRRCGQIGFHMHWSLTTAVEYTEALQEATGREFQHPLQKMNISFVYLACL